MQFSPNMGGEANQIFQGMNSNEVWRCNKMMIMEGESSSFENSFSSKSSSDLVDDASSSATSSSSSSSNGPLYELSEIMAQLPIKRGLSKHYQGKSQSFTSLASVRSIEDLPKKVIPFYNNRAARMKSCKSFGWGLNGQINNKLHSPKPTISKKASASASTRACFLSSIGKRNTTSLVISERI